MRLFKNNDENFIELLKGSSISLILKVFAMLLGYASMLFITNFYGAEEWGIYSLCFTLLSIAVLLPKFGFDNSLVRIITELNTYNNHKEIKRVLFKALAISIIITILIVVVINSFSDVIIAKILKQNNLKPYIKLISLCVLPIVILTIISATFQAFKKTMLFMLFQTAFINFVFLILLLIYHYLEISIKIFELYYYSALITMIISIFTLYCFLNKKSLSLQQKEIKYGFKKIANISLPMLLSSSFALLMGWSDIIMLSYFKTATDIGIYNSALKLAALSSITLIAVNAIATPKFVEFYSKMDMSGLESIVKKSTKMIFYSTAPVLIILIIFSKKILGLFGDEFSIGYLALIYLCIASFINAISGSVGYIMQMTNQQKTYQNIIITAFIINLILNIILIPKYSFNGAALASSLAMIFWNIALVIIIKRKFGFWTVYIPFLVK
uniref:oligosaccharide flippase family protein n=1 Tax=Gelidibacter sp. TaxID=2018083 RepID=UPI00404AF87B